MKHLYVSDLDGTLLHSNVAPSSWARKQLCDLLEAGISFTVATARGVVSIKEILHDLPFQLPVVGGNGAYISDFKSGEHIHCQAIPSPIVKELLALLESRKKGYFVSSYMEWEDRLYYEQVRNEAMQFFLEERALVGDKRIRFRKNLRTCYHETVLTVSIPDRPASCLSLKYELEERYPGELEIHIYDDARPTGWHWMSIHDKHATKANGIQRIADTYGYELDHITVFGDSTNDVSMFKVAGRSIAVENAKPELKSLATHTIGHHEEDSVVKFILEDLFL